MDSGFGSVRFWFAGFRSVDRKQALVPEYSLHAATHKIRTCRYRLVHRPGRWSDQGTDTCAVG